MKKQAVMMAVMARVCGTMFGMRCSELAALIAHLVVADPKSPHGLHEVRPLNLTGGGAVVAAVKNGNGDGTGVVNVTAVRDDGGEVLYVRAGSVAIINIAGVLDKSDDDVSWSYTVEENGKAVSKRYFWGTSYNRIRDAVARAVADSQVRDIVLNCDTPGGNAMSVEPASLAVQEVAKSAKKVTAYVNDLCASAGFYIASQANRVFTSPGGWTGSIGTIATYADWSKYLDEAGIKVTAIKQPDHKDAGSPYRPMSEKDRELLQKDVDAYFNAFKAAVKRGRGVSDAKVNEWVDGRGYVGAAAVASGICDGVVATLGELVAGLNNNGGGRVPGAAGTRAEVAGGGEVVAVVNENAGAAGDGETNMRLLMSAAGLAASSLLMNTGGPDGAGSGGGGGVVAGAPDAAALKMAGRAEENERRAAIDTVASLFPEVEGIKALHTAAIANTSVSADKFRADVLAKVAEARKPIVQVPSQQSAAGGAGGGGVAIGNDRRKAGLELALMAAACGCVGTVSQLMAGVAIANPQAVALGFSDGMVAAKAFSDLRSTGLRGLSAMEIASAFIVASGKHTEAEVAEMRSDGVGHRFMAALTSSDFPKVLENVQNKTLNAAIATQQFVWNKFCAVRRANDYKTIGAYSLSGMGNLDLNPEGQPATLTSMNEKRETGNVKKYAKKVGLTFEMLKNDDLGAFGDMVMKLLQAASRVPEQLFFAVLLANSGLGPTMTNDTKALIHTDHSNIGSGATLTYDALCADRRSFLKKTGFGPGSGAVAAGGVARDEPEYLDIAPKLLLTSVDNSDTARNLCIQEYAPGTSGTSGASMQRNILRGLLEPVTSARLGTTNRRWLFADPAEAAVFAMYFLDGQQNPVIHSLPGMNPYVMEQQVTMPGVGCFAVGYEGVYSDAGQ